jgi:hypothetical protein
VAGKSAGGDNGRCRAVPRGRSQGGMKAAEVSWTNQT